MRGHCRLEFEYQPEPSIQFNACRILLVTLAALLKSNPINARPPPFPSPVTNSKSVPRVVPILTTLALLDEDAEERKEDLSNIGGRDVGDSIFRWKRLQDGRSHVRYRKCIISLKRSQT